MLSLDKNWSLTLASATLAVLLALAGLMATALGLPLTPLAASGILAGSLAFTATAFVRVAMRLRRLELVNEGLIEEISQEFDRVKDKIEIFQDALADDARTIEPQEAAPLRRVAVK